MGDRAEIPEDDYAALVRGLLDDLEGTAITRLELRHGDLRVALRRVPGALAVRLDPELVAARPAESGRPEHWHAIEAPLTGIFFGRPSPDDLPYVELGSHVEADHVVGLIETMKMFNEILADVAGTVREIVVDNGALVQSGEPLLYIEPDEAAV